MIRQDPSVIPHLSGSKGIRFKSGFTVCWGINAEGLYSLFTIT